MKMVNVDAEVELARKNDEEAIEDICKIIDKYKNLTHWQLGRIVADMCGVTVEEMFGNDRHLPTSQARWLYWFAYHYMTNESYEAIAKINPYRKFSASGVGKYTRKMYDLISANTIWTRRWIIIKQIIKGIRSNLPKQQELFEESITVKVTAPKGVNVELEQK